MKKIIFLVVSHIFVCVSLVIAFSGCGKNMPLGALSAFTGIYPSDKEIAESIETKCLTLEQSEDRGKFADFMQFEEGYYLHLNNADLYKVGKSYLVKTSLFFGKKGIISFDEQVGRTLLKSCQE